MDPSSPVFSTLNTGSGMEKFGFGSQYIYKAFLILMYVVFADPNPDEIVLGIDPDLALAPDLTLDPFLPS
jgi:hypothetical protein